jgi:serine/threonine protein kinase
MAAWPTGADYSEAIQNPRTAFADSELAQGQAEVGPTGFPKPRSGAFATVFKVKSVHCDWAVRCFTREVQDQQDRYEQISSHLRTVALPYMVGFTFLAKGIKIKGAWYPIIKMEWVHGEPLKSYIERNLHNPNSLMLLADRWMSMIHTLHNANVAHGDLQHGNIIVVNGDFKLVDYDGMFVPGLSGRSSNEVGHRNYQHPQRTAKDFGPNLDNFSAWVIYISLRLIAADPSLWQEAQAQSDEALVFRREDFEDPDMSEILRTMEFSSDPSVEQAYHLFRSILSTPAADIPAVETQAGIAMPCVDTSNGDWVQDHISAKASQPAQPDIASVNKTPVYGASWIDSHVPPLPKQRFTISFLMERVLFFFSIASVAAGAIAEIRARAFAASIGFGQLGIMAANPLLWIIRYRGQAPVRELAAVRKKQKPLRDGVLFREDFIEKGKAKKRSLTSHYDPILRELASKAAAIRSAEMQEIDSWQKGLAVSTTALHPLNANANAR